MFSGRAPTGEEHQPRAGDSATGADSSALAVEYLAVGHVTLDVVAHGGHRIGGSVTYAAAAAAGLGLRAAVVTRHGPDFQADRLVPQVRWRAVPDGTTTTFTNVYGTDGHRVQSLGALAAPLSAFDVPPSWRRVGVLHVAPVMAEVDGATVAAVEADFVGITAQGWLRRAGEGGVVTPSPWSMPDEILRRADAVVVSEEDLGSDRDRFEWLVRHVPVAVLTRGAAGAMAVSAGETVRQAAVPARAIDPTGAGDVFSAVLFVRLWEGATIAEALSWAAAAGSIAVEGTAEWDAITRQRIAGRLAGRI